MVRPQSMSNASLACHKGAGAIRQRFACYFYRCWDWYTTGFRWGGGWIQPILCDTRGWFLNLGLRVSCHSRLSCSHPWTSENDPSKCQQIKCAAVLGLLLGVGAVGMVCVGQKSARKSGGLHLESALGANREHWRATPHGTIPQQGSACRDPSKPVFSPGTQRNTCLDDGVLDTGGPVVQAIIVHHPPPFP